MTPTDRRLLLNVARWARAQGWRHEVLRYPDDEDGQHEHVWANGTRRVHLRDWDRAEVFIEVRATDRPAPPRLCQTCGNPLTHPAVLFGGPNQLRSRHFDEPPLCAPCALYASQACPMVAGRMPHYATRERLSEGNRGHVCPDGDCPCGGFVASDPNAYDASGEPAHPWYAVYARLGAWQLTGNEVQARCSDGGCSRPHKRLLVNGALLIGEPLKVVLVSSPDEGRVWRRLAADDLAALAVAP